MMSDNENEKRETLAAIVAEWEEAIRNAGSTEACLREAIRQIKCLNDMRPHDGLGYEINDVIDVANSIKGKNGNAAAMREALEKVAVSSEYALKHDDLDCGDLRGFIEEMGQDARAALSAPARNCDRLSAEQCKKIFKMEMGIYIPQEATDRDRDIARCTAYGVIDALFAPSDAPFEPSTHRKGEGDGR